MRSLRVLGLVGVIAGGGYAHAEVSVSGQVGAGAQGDSTYSAVELRLDAAWTRGHVGLGARGVWDDTQFRGSEWATRWAAIAIIRDVAIAGKLGDVELAAAAGALAPAHVGRIVDGYRVALDDRWRTGVRLAARSEDLEAGAEIDDVLAPRLIAGGLTLMIARPWGVHASIAGDPLSTPCGRAVQPCDPGTAAAGELGGFRRFEGKRARLDVGASLVVEPDPSGVVHATGAVERAEIRWTARADVRAGRGGLFGPLHRVEGIDDAFGVGAGISGGAVSERGWFEIGARRRPGLGGLYAAQAGAPMGRWVQAAAWAAVATHAAAGAAAVRVAWSKRLFSAVQAARMYQFDAMEPEPVWSVTAWFGAASL